MALCVVPVSEMVLARCMSAVELHRYTDNVRTIWDYYLSDIALTKVCKYKQGGLVLDKGGNLW